MPHPTLEFIDQVASSATNITVNRFQKYFAEGSLQLRPAYQRNLVWNAEQQSLLIDSVLRGMPVPEIYVQTVTEADGGERIVVVDGQQRISACLRFLAGDLRLVCRPGSESEFDPRWFGQVFKDLDDDLKARFRGYHLVARGLPPSLGEQELREIFRRLNTTVEPLQPQELRHAAYSGDFIQFVEQAASHPVFEDLGVFTARDYLRRRSDELVAEIAFAVISQAFPNKKEGLDELFLTYDRQGMPSGSLDDLAARFGRVFRQLEPMAEKLRKTRFRNKSDFYSLFVALANRAPTLPAIGNDADSLRLRLENFSKLVNELKRVEDEADQHEELEADPLASEATKYLRAVERAASDRLSRVRRNEALDAVLEPLLSRNSSTDLSPEDQSWRAELGATSQDDTVDDDENLERSRAAEVLTSAPIVE